MAPSALTISAANNNRKRIYSRRLLKAPPEKEERPLYRFLRYRAIRLRGCRQREKQCSDRRTRSISGISEEKTVSSHFLRHRGNVSAYRRIGVSAFAKHHQLRGDLPVIIAMSKSSLTSPGADTPIRRTADALPQPPPVSETSTNSRMGNILVYRLAYNVMSPQVSWLLFKARAKRPYLDPCGSIRRGGGKTANRPRPGGLR
jgi:hypothetical protein